MIGVLRRLNNEDRLWVLDRMTDDFVRRLYRRWCRRW